MRIIQVVSHKFKDNEDSDFTLKLKTDSRIESKLKEITLSPTIEELCVVSLPVDSTEYDILVTNINKIEIIHDNFVITIDNVVPIQKKEDRYVFLGNLNHKKRSE